MVQQVNLENGQARVPTGGPDTTKGITSNDLINVTEVLGIRLNQQQTPSQVSEVQEPEQKISTDKIPLEVGEKAIAAVNKAREKSNGVPYNPEGMPAKNQSDGISV